MQIQLCRKSVQRLGDPAAFLTALRDREHAPLVKDCLDRCQRCDTGVIVATVDGMPMNAATVEQFLTDVDTLAAEE